MKLVWIGLAFTQNPADPHTRSVVISGIWLSYMVSYLVSVIISGIECESDPLWNCTVPGWY